MSLDSNVILVDVISGIVDSIRETGSISNVVVTDGISAVTSANTLNEGDVVTIAGADYVTYDVTTASFKVEGDVSAGTSWTAKPPYYMYGHPKEIRQRLQERDSGPTLKYQKYPLIALIQDFPEDMTDPELYAEVKITVVIVGYTKKDYYSEDRYTNVLKPVLYPIYNDLLEAIFNDSNFWFDPSLTKPKHTKTDRLFYGTESVDGNVANQYADHLDAIEVSNLELRIRNPNTC